MPAIGATMARRSKGPARRREGELGVRSASSASHQLTASGVAVLEVRSAFTRSSLASASSSAILARSTAISSVSESSLAMTVPASTAGAGRDQEFSQPAGAIGFDRDRAVGAAGADGRQPVVDGGGGHRAVTTIVCAPACCCRPPPLRRCALSAVAVAAARPVDAPAGQNLRRAGKNIAQAAAQRPRTTSEAKANCFQADIRHSGSGDIGRRSSPAAHGLADATASTSQYGHRVADFMTILPAAMHSV